MTPDATGTTPARTRVLLVEDETLIREALASLLALEEDLEVVGRAGSVAEAQAVLRSTEVDVALLDLQLPDGDGIDLAVHLAQVQPQAASLVITSHGRPGYLKRALENGVRGFLPKTVGRRALTEAVRTLATGGRYVDQELAADALAAGASPLSAREADVLELSADAAPVEEIAERAHLSPGTVRNYLSAAVTKTGTANRHEAARVARAKGWI
ncbi:response regulator [Kytococcus schroeteri]|uniref:response regulator transcription factor n=1 Tax=Kytococcus schroeteri TaxID=138300 RepID=UPI0035EAEACC